MTHRVPVASAARDLGPEVVLVTSVLHDRAAADTIEMVAVTGEGAWSVTTPRLPRSFTGVGDLTAAVFLAGLLDAGGPPPLAAASVTCSLGRTAAMVLGVLRATAASGQAELQLVAGQEEIARPTYAATVIRLD